MLNMRIWKQSLSDLSLIHSFSQIHSFQNKANKIEPTINAFRAYVHEIGVKTELSDINLRYSSL